MQIILKKDVKGTGKEGELVKVSDGFARNRLIPKGFAVEATDKNKRALKKEKEERAERIARETAEAKEFVKILEANEITVKTRVGEGGKLFGSITSMDIAEAIKKQTGKTIDKKKIVLSRPVKEIGTFEIEVKVYPEISAKVKVNVAGE